MGNIRPRKRLPAWLKARAPGSRNYLRLKGLANDLQLNTVCESANCPNVGECWGQGTATFMILGDICTRSCGFCAIKTGRPAVVDEDEPERVARAVSNLGLRHAVITSVARDELTDGGASIFARTLEALHRHCPGTSVEALIPDFKGNLDALKTVLDAAPDILNHNLESVPRLYPQMRPQAGYQRSLQLLDRARKMSSAPTKSGIMLGAGETAVEIEQALRDLAAAQCSILTIGQYLSPSADHMPVKRFVKPEEFDEWREFSMGLGFLHVESGPLVRSSYHAEKQLPGSTVVSRTLVEAPPFATVTPTYSTHPTTP